MTGDSKLPGFFQKKKTDYYGVRSNLVVYRHEIGDLCMTYVVLKYTF